MWVRFLLGAFLYRFSFYIGVPYVYARACDLFLRRLGKDRPHVVATSSDPYVYHNARACDLFLRRLGKDRPHVVATS